LVAGLGVSDDSLYGGNSSDVLRSAGSGDSAPGSHVLDGGAAQDVLWGHQGSSTEFRLSGDGDTVHVRTREGETTSVGLMYPQAPGGVVVDLRAGFGQVIGSSVRDTFRGIEDPAVQDVFVRGTSDEDQLLGSDEPKRWDVLHGQRGADLLRGRAGHDALWGDTGADHLHGGPGRDNGGGGPGRDTCVAIENIIDGC
jgi:Ca2+-binding RTX toxin-like protein